MCRFGTALVLLSVTFGLGLGNAEEFDPDQLEQVVITLNNGTEVLHVRHQNRLWRKAEVHELAATTLPGGPQICFVAKYQGQEDGVIKLLKCRGRVVVQDPGLVKLLKPLRLGENVWICGKLRKSEQTRRLELVVADIRKTRGDLALARDGIQRMIAAGNASGLIAEGRRIARLLKTSIYDFGVREGLQIEQRRAWRTGLKLKELKLGEDDVEGRYELALEWERLLNRRSEAYRLIRDALRINPDHVEASRVAFDQMGMRKIDGKWITREEHDRRVAAGPQKEPATTGPAIVASDPTIFDGVALARARQRLLTLHQTALRTRDIKRLEEAFKALGKAIRHTSDPTFGRMGVKILANSGDPSAVWPGLDQAIHTSFPIVRQDAYEALVWLGNESALGVLSLALRSEKDPACARVGVQAIVDRGVRNRQEIETLVSGLDNANPEVVAEVVSGLARLTGQQQADRDAWKNWWIANRHQYSPTTEKAPSSLPR